MNYPIIFLDRNNKTKLAPASFSYFLELLWEKNKFSLKSVTVVTVTTSLFNKENKKTVLSTLFLHKSNWIIKLGGFKSDHKYFAK